LRRLSLTPILALLLILPAVAEAQTHRGALRGQVLDPNRAVIPGATIKLTNQETEEIRVVSRENDG
jgi:hypothetical protein